MRRVIDERGRWQLAVTGEHVVASRHLPGEPSKWYTTESDHRRRTRESWGLSPREVVDAYRRECQTSTPATELHERVETALAGDDALHARLSAENATGGRPRTEAQL